MAITFITLLMASWWVLHKLAHVIVTQYRMTGGLVVCGAIYASSLDMERYWVPRRRLWEIQASCQKQLALIS